MTSIKQVLLSYRVNNQVFIQNLLHTFGRFYNVKIKNIQLDRYLSIVS